MVANDEHLTSEQLRRRFQAAAGTAAVAGALSLVLCALMIGRALRESKMHPLTSRQALDLADAREALRVHPGNEALRGEIRRRDEALVTTYLRSQAFYRRAKWVLVAAVVTSLIGVNLAWRYRKRLVAPDARRGIGYDSRLSRWGRLAVAALLVVLASGGAFLAASAPQLGYDRIAAALPAQPTPAGPTAAPAAAPKSPQKNELAEPPPSEGWWRVAKFPSRKELAENWPRFRGPGGLGLAPAARPPLTFDAKTGENLAWRTPVPLGGHSSPVVWGEKVFLTGADRNDKKRQVYCFDAYSGRLLWSRDVAEGPPRAKRPENVMQDTGFASPTMVADAERVYAMFAMGEVVCFDHEGNKVWGRFVGPLDTEYGHAASLAMHVVSPTKARIVLQLDQAVEEDKLSKLVMLDAATGRIDGQVPRPVGSAWTSPIVIKTRLWGEQIITCANPWAIAYDAGDGRELWRMDCLAGDGAPSPIFAGGWVIAGNVGSGLVAIHPGGRGNVTKTHEMWYFEDDVPDISSPVCDGTHVYMVTSDGMLTCLRLADGRKVFNKDLEMSFTASPTIVRDRLYMLSKKGVMVVAEAGAAYKELARSMVHETCRATPAFVGRSIYIRTEKHLCCIRSRIGAPGGVPDAAGSAAARVAFGAGGPRGTGQ